MKAITYSKYGGPEVLELKETGKPVPADNEVLLKVHAVSINDWDLGLLDGTSLINRMMSGLSGPTKINILGSDVAGVVEAVGKNVTRWKAGDAVYGDLSGKWGGFAEYVCAGENALAEKPPAMSFEQAAAIPQAAMLAVQGLIDHGKMQQGHRLLINGAGGGVGTFALQMAVSRGVEVTVVDHTVKLDMLKEMGARNVIDYTREDFTKRKDEYDIILDVKTNRSVFDYLRVLSPAGVYVTVGGSINRFLQILLLRPFISLFSKKKLRIVVLKPNKDLVYMNQLFEAGTLAPVIDRQYSLEETGEAFRFYGTALHKGKIVISV